MYAFNTVFFLTFSERSNLRVSCVMQFQSIPRIVLFLWITVIASTCIAGKKYTIIIQSQQYLGRVIRFPFKNSFACLFQEMFCGISVDTTGTVTAVNV